MSEFKAIIFDIYGTLLKSEVGDLDDSLNKADIQIKVLDKLKEKYSLTFDSEIILQDFKKNIDHEHKKKENRGILYPEVIIERIWLQTIPDLGGNEKAKEFAYDFYDLSGKRYLYEGTKEVLKCLKEQKKYLGIISNAQFYTEKDMNSLLGVDLFKVFDKELCFFSFVEGCSKPNPQSFLKLLEELANQGVESEDILYVGNHSVKDIRTAQKCGIKACLFKSDEVVFSKGIEPDFQIESLIEILDLIN